MTEKLIEKKLCDLVKSLGGLAIKFFSPWFTGMPDRMILMPGGRLYFVEVKAEGVGLKKESRQSIVIPMLRKLGFVVAVINSESGLNDFKKLIA